MGTGEKLDPTQKINDQVQLVSYERRKWEIPRRNLKLGILYSTITKIIIMQLQQ